MGALHDATRAKPLDFHDILFGMGRARRRSLKSAAIAPIYYVSFRRDAPMSDAQQYTTPRESDRTLAIVAHALFLAGLLTAHLAAVGAVIIAYVQRDQARGTIWQSHYEAIISTFWTSLAVGVFGIIACITIVGLIVGVPLLIGLAIWVLYRAIRGLIHALDDRPY
jgi:uncharacterized membrane protein